MAKITELEPNPPLHNKEQGKATVDRFGSTIVFVGTSPLGAVGLKGGGDITTSDFTAESACIGTCGVAPTPSPRLVPHLPSDSPGQGRGVLQKQVSLATTEMERRHTSMATRATVDSRVAGHFSPAAGIGGAKVHAS